MKHTPTRNAAALEGAKSKCNLDRSESDRSRLVLRFGTGDKEREPASTMDVARRGASPPLARRIAPHRAARGGGHPRPPEVEVAVIPPHPLIKFYKDRHLWHVPPSLGPGRDCSL